MSWSDAEYRRAFADGHSRNEYVAELIAKQGLWVECPPLAYASDKSERSNFTKTEKDVITRAGTIEVKGQGKLFTGDPSSFPFPTIIVDTVSGWVGKMDKPIAYVFVCMENNECLVVPGKSKPSWIVKRLFDNKKKIFDDFYVAPKSSLTTVVKLFEYLRKHEQS